MSKSSELSSDDLKNTIAGGSSECASNFSAPISSFIQHVSALFSKGNHSQDTKKDRTLSPEPSFGSDFSTQWPVRNTTDEAFGDKAAFAELPRENDDQDSARYVRQKTAKAKANVHHDAGSL